jgi:hypothetical protein
MIGNVLRTWSEKMANNSATQGSQDAGNGKKADPKGNAEYQHAYKKMQQEIAKKNR